MTALRLLAALLAALALLTVTGCGDDVADPTASTAAHAQDPRFDYARGLFTKLCAGCHTFKDADAHGKRYALEEAGVATILETKAQRINLARAVILEGEGDGHRSGVGMPAWRGVLSDKEIEALATYIGTVVEPNRHE